MAATPKNKAKVNQDIHALDLEDAFIEEKMRGGILSADEGKKQRLELYEKRFGLTQELDTAQEPITENSGHKNKHEAKNEDHPQHGHVRADEVDKELSGLYDAQANIQRDAKAGKITLEEAAKKTNEIQQKIEAQRVKIDGIITEQQSSVAAENKTRIETAQKTVKPEPTEVKATDIAQNTSAAGAPPPPTVTISAPPTVITGAAVPPSSQDNASDPAARTVGKFGEITFKGGADGSISGAITEERGHGGKIQEQISAVQNGTPNINPDNVLETSNVNAAPASINPAEPATVPAETPQFTPSAPPPDNASASLPSDIGGTSDFSNFTTTTSQPVTTVSPPTATITQNASEEVPMTIATPTVKTTQLAAPANPWDAIRTPRPAAPVSSKKAALQKGAKVTGKVLTYTPQGFIAGKVISTFNAKSKGHEMVLETESNIREEKKKSDSTRPNPPTKNSSKPKSKAAKSFFGILKYGTIPGLMYVATKKIFPTTQKETSQKAAEQNPPDTHITTTTQDAPNSAISSEPHLRPQSKDEIHSPSPKMKPPKIQRKSTKILKGILKYTTAPGLIYTATKAMRPKKEEEQKKNVEQKAPAVPKKTNLQYQKVKNQNIISRAISKGYDRYALLRKVRDSKIWKSKSWKYGKYVALTPAGGAAVDAVKWMRRPTQGRHQESRNEQAPSFTRPQSAIKSRFSPSRLSNFSRPNMSGLGNKVIDKGPKGALKGARKKVTTKLAKKVAATLARSFIFSGPGLAVLGICAAVLLIFCGITMFIVLIKGGGDLEQRGSGNTVPPENTAPTVNPIPGFSLTLDGQSQIDTCQDVTSADCAIEYTITYTHSESSVPLETITVYNDLPQNATFESGGTVAEYNSSTRVVSWKLSDTTNTSPLKLRIKPTGNDQNIKMEVYALAIDPNEGVISPSSGNLKDVFAAAAQTYGVPVALTRAIAKTESAAHDSYTNDDVAQFNTLNWWATLSDDAPSVSELPLLISKGYAYNTCAYPKSNPICPGSDVRGATQFLLSTWDSVKNRIPTINSTEGDRRYVTDAVFGQARHTKDIIEKYDSDFGFSNNPADFTEAQVKAVATSYCGGNPFANINVPACGNGAYDDNVWDYYQQIRATLNQ